MGKYCIGKNGFNFPLNQDTDHLDNIRALLDATFDDEALRILCYDRPASAPASQPTSSTTGPQQSARSGRLRSGHSPQPARRHRLLQSGRNSPEDESLQGGSRRL